MSMKISNIADKTSYILHKVTYISNLFKISNIIYKLYIILDI